MMRLVLCGLCLAATAVTGQVQTGQGNGAVLRALDKLSGKVVDISMQAGSAARFEELEIVLTECRYPDGNPSGDAYAGLHIKARGKEDVIFSGWMVASSPALNAMEHPRYDIWVMRCTISS